MTIREKHPDYEDKLPDMVRVRVCFAIVQVLVLIGTIVIFVYGSSYIYFYNSLTRNERPFNFPSAIFLRAY